MYTRGSMLTKIVQNLLTPKSYQRLSRLQSTDAKRSDQMGRESKSVLADLSPLLKGKHSAIIFASF